MKELLKLLVAAKPDAVGNLFLWVTIPGVAATGRQPNEYAHALKNAALILNGASGAIVYAGPQDKYGAWGIAGTVSGLLVAGKLDAANGGISDPEAGTVVDSAGTSLLADFPDAVAST